MFSKADLDELDRALRQAADADHKAELGTKPALDPKWEQPITLNLTYREAHVMTLLMTLGSAVLVDDKLHGAMTIALLVADQEHIMSALPSGAKKITQALTQAEQA